MRGATRQTTIARREKKRRICSSRVIFPGAAGSIAGSRQVESGSVAGRLGLDLYSGLSWEAMMMGLVSGAETVKAARERRTPYGFRVLPRFCSTDYLVRGVLVLVGVIGCAGVASAGTQAAPAAGQESKDACAPVQAAYQKTTSASNSSKATNTGGLNVAEAYDKITSEAGHKETCKYLRDETVTGEDANVYSDVFASKSGRVTGTVWISKKNGWVLKREVDVEIAGVGKGHQSIVFEYPPK